MHNLLQPDSLCNRPAQSEGLAPKIPHPDYNNVERRAEKVQVLQLENLLPVIFTRLSRGTTPSLCWKRLHFSLLRVNEGCSRNRPACSPSTSAESGGHRTCTSSHELPGLVVLQGTALPGGPQGSGHILLCCPVPLSAPPCSPSPPAQPSRPLIPIFRPPKRGGNKGNECKGL